MLASKCKKPDDAGVAKLLKPQADVIGQITQFREANRRSPQYNHLSTISESIAALSWVVTVSDIVVCGDFDLLWVPGLALFCSDGRL